MVNKTDSMEFRPTITIPPGATIRENMGLLGIDQKELATRLDMTEEHLSNILNSNAPITYETALKLEVVIGPSAEFWMNLETNYQLNKARLQKQEELEQELEILKEIPYKEMSHLGWVEKTADRYERVYNCREFFVVARLSSIEPSHAVMYRKQKLSKGISDLGVLAWLRKAEVEGMSREVNKFSKRKLGALIPVFRKLTMEKPAVYYPKMVELCAACGVSLVLVEHLPRTYICGATLWKKKNPIIALSLRGKRADVF